MCAYTSLRRRGGNISVDFSLFVLLYETNFKNKHKLKDFINIKNTGNSLNVHMFFNLQNPPTVHSEEKVAQLTVRGRACFVDLSILLGTYRSVPKVPDPADQCDCGPHGGVHQAPARVHKVGRRLTVDHLRM